MVSCFSHPLAARTLAPQERCGDVNQHNPQRRRTCDAVNDAESASFASFADFGKTRIVDSKIGSFVGTHSRCSIA